MNVISSIKQEISAVIKELFQVSDDQLAGVAVQLNVDKEKSFGDLSCNAAMVLAKQLRKNPRQSATELQDALMNASSDVLKKSIASVEIAGPGFLNITLKPESWQQVVQELLTEPKGFFQLTSLDKKLKYLIEFVSINPTGPVHLGAGRNGIIGDVLANVLKFLGHTVHKEYYINDAGNQIKLLGESLQARCFQEMGEQIDLPEGGYVGDYLIDVAKECVNEHGDELHQKDIIFFSDYAKRHMLQMIKNTLNHYGIQFDEWFSEKTLHDSGAVNNALEDLKNKDLAYEKDGATWFKATEFGDDKDRVVKKHTGEMTYIAGDIAYHKNKFDRGYDKLIDIMGQDHHGYVKRLKATMEALGYPAKNLDVILYQLVSIKKNDEFVKMSKRAGTFTELEEVIDTVGRDVTRFFYLNRKAEAHLDFDLTAALKKTDENPVFYMQYAFVRTLSVLGKAEECAAFKEYVEEVRRCLLDSNQTCDSGSFASVIKDLSDAEIDVIKKIAALQDVLKSIEVSYQTHLLAYYAWELALAFHRYYANNRIVDEANEQTTKVRLLMVALVRNTLAITLDLLGVSKPEKM